MILVMLGFAVGLYLVWSLLSGPHRAYVEDGHLVYETGQAYPLLVGAAYLLATVLPLIVSTQRTLNTLGLVVLVGALAVYFAYPEAFLSVWCFFAAAASALLVFHFERRHRMLEGHATP